MLVWGHALGLLRFVISLPLTIFEVLLLMPRGSLIVFTVVIIIIMMIGLNYHIIRSNLGSSFCSGLSCLTFALRSLSMARILKRPSSSVIKKPSSSVKKVGKVVGHVSNLWVGGTRYKVPKWMSRSEALRTLKINVTANGVKEIFFDQSVIENYHAVEPAVYGTLSCGMRVKVEVKPNGCEADWVQNFSDDINMSKVLENFKKENLKKQNKINQKKVSKKLGKIKTQSASYKKQLEAKMAKVALKAFEKIKVSKKKSLTKG